jgi:hypothetical protein
MQKSDKSIHNICIASIKRSTIKPYDFKSTGFYEGKEIFFSLYEGLINDFAEEELPVCSTIIDAENWSVLTTRRLLTNESGQLLITTGFTKVIGISYGDFKGHGQQVFTLGNLRFENGTKMNYFIETGRASMVMINGIKTRIRLHHLSES